MPFGEISSSPAAAVAALRLSLSPCSQNSRSISHSSQSAMHIMMTRRWVAPGQRWEAQVMHSVVTGRAARRSSLIEAPQLSQMP